MLSINSLMLNNSKREYDDIEKDRIINFEIIDSTMGNWRPVNWFGLIHEIVDHDLKIYKTWLFYAVSSWYSTGSQYDNIGYRIGNELSSYVRSKNLYKLNYLKIKDDNKETRSNTMVYNNLYYHYIGHTTDSYTAILSDGVEESYENKLNPWISKIDSNPIYDYFFSLFVNNIKGFNNNKSLFWLNLLLYGHNSWGGRYGKKISLRLKGLYSI